MRECTLNDTCYSYFECIIVQRKIYQKAARYLNTIEKTQTPGIGLNPLFSPGVRKSKTFYVKARE